MVIRVSISFNPASTDVRDAIGRVRNNNYQDNDGVEVYGLAFTVDEIDYLDSKAEGEARRARESAGDPAPAAPSAPNSSRKARSERQPAHA